MTEEYRQRPGENESSDDAPDQSSNNNSSGCFGAIFAIGLYIYVIYSLVQGFNIPIITLCYWLFRALMALGSAVLLFMLLNWICRLDEKSGTFEGWIYNIWLVADEIPIIKQLLKVAPLIAAPGKLFKSLLKRKSLVVGSIFIALLSINLEKPIQSLLHLPPQAKTAAYVVYYASIIHYLKGNSLFDSTENTSDMLTYLRDKSDLSDHPYHSDPSKSYDELRPALIEAYNRRMKENPKFEFRSELYFQGTSLLQLILERELNTRTAEDLAKLITDAPPEIKHDYDLAMNANTKESDWLDFKNNLIYVPFMLIIGACCWLLQPANSRNFRKCIAAGSYMVVALLLFHIVFFSLLASFNYLVFAVAFAAILDTVYFEIWLLRFLPAILKIPKIRLLLVGNIIMISLQIVGYLYVTHLLNTN